MMGSFACACYTDSWLMAVTRGALRRSAMTRVAKKLP